jgi:hypothetical protein
MKTRNYVSSQLYKSCFLAFLALVLVSCGSYQSVYNAETDGIYASNAANKTYQQRQNSQVQTSIPQQQLAKQVAVLPQANTNNNTNFFANELKMMEVSDDEEVITGVDNYYPPQENIGAGNAGYSSWNDNANLTVNVNPGFGYQDAFFNHFNAPFQQPFWGANAFYGDPWVNRWGTGFNRWGAGFNTWGGGFNRWSVGFNNFGWGFNNSFWNNYYGFYQRPGFHRNRFFGQRNFRNGRGRFANRNIYRSYGQRSSGIQRNYRGSRGNSRRNFSRTGRINSSRRNGSVSRNTTRYSQNLQRRGYGNNRNSNAQGQRATGNNGVRGSKARNTSAKTSTRQQRTSRRSSSTNRSVRSANRGSQRQSRGVQRQGRSIRRSRN